MNIFRRKAQTFEKRARLQALSVLIWGPGKPGKGASDAAKKGYKKKKLMRRTLRKYLPNAEVEFSENLDNEGILDPFVAEGIDAQGTDLVIILDISPGANLERTYYTQYDWFRSRAWILVPQEYVNTRGLVGKIYGRIPRHQVQGFTAEEFDRCDVATKLSLRVAKTVAAKKLLEQSRA